MNSRLKLLILKDLLQLYPNPKSELDYKSAYQLLIAVVLSAQCTDKKVNQVTPALFKEFPNFKALANAKLKELEQILNSINYYKTKSRNLIALGTKVVEEYESKIPETMESLITLPGVGRKTASVVLGELEICHTLPVDTHVFRLARRIGFSKGKDVIEVEQDLRKGFESKDWRSLHHCLILHGRRICKARSPDCLACSINKNCQKNFI